MQSLLKRTGRTTPQRHTRSRQPCQVAVVALLGVACTNADLYGVDVTKSIPNKITYFGQVCTDSPIQRDLPIKVVFVMDGSSLTPGANNQPNWAGEVYRSRADAVQKAIDRYPLSRNYSFAMVRYAGTTNSATNDRFTSNASDLLIGAQDYAAPCLAQGMDCNARNYDLAFSRASSIIEGDMLRSTPGERSRTTYVIIFHAEGPHLEPTCDPPNDCFDKDPQCPDPSQTCVTYSGQCCGLAPLAVNTDEEDCDEACYFERRVRKLQAKVLEEGAAGLQVHTAHLQYPALSTPPQCAAGAEVDDPEQCRAFRSLERMAAAGGGSYTAAKEVPGLLELTTFDLRRADNVFIKKSLLAVNLNARPQGDRLMVDSDVDGLPDDQEVKGGCPSPYNRDSDGDGLGDGFERRLSEEGLDVCTPNLISTCADLAPGTDTDGDMLTDCEERLLRLEPTLFDSDADGYPDLVEYLYGTNFLSNDIDRDDDFDGMSNGVELSAHTDPRSNDARTRQQLSYLNKIVNLGVMPILVVQKPRKITGVSVDGVTARVATGQSVLFYHPGPPPTLAWHDSIDQDFGPAVTVDKNGEYVLQSASSEPGSIDTERGLKVSVIKQLLAPESLSETLQIRETEHECTDFRIRNITLVHTRPGQPGEGQNEILIYFSEVPALSTRSPGIFRVARSVVTYVPPEYKDPDVADLKIEDHRFVLFE